MTEDFQEFGLARLSEKLADLTLAVHTPRFPAALLGLFQALSHPETIVAFAFFDNRTPTVLFEGGGEEEMAINAYKYTEGHYLFDPFYVAFQNRQRGCLRLRDIAPDDFQDSEYYRQYYKSIGITDEVGYLIPIGLGTSIHLSLSVYDGAARFETEDLKLLNQILPLVNAIASTHWQKTTTENYDSEVTISQTRAHALVRRAYRGFGLSVLTEREAQIVRLMMHGHSAKSAARVLDISPGTVMNHRRHIYDKLEINSAPELFSLFFRSLNVASFNPGEDPLDRLRNGEKNDQPEDSALQLAAKQEA